ncbi:MAG: FeoB-associated Cys-rich membrane protein [Bacteroidaceae bacterium]|nr:FeoB-associated Cys-rich membrane protein [Bacteroidaceae bacterium]
MRHWLPSSSEALSPMNLQSILLLAVILAVAAVALYFWLRNCRGGNGCCNCSHSSCPHHPKH